jgi:hypothetical protein
MLTPCPQASDDDVDEPDTDQIYLGETEGELLERVSRASMASISALVRRATRSTSPVELTKEEELAALERSFGSLGDRGFTGAEIRRRDPSRSERAARRLGLSREVPRHDRRHRPPA